MAAPSSTERIVTRAAIVAAARSWIGTPYRHQGSMKGTACDCLGLVRGVWRDLYGAEPEAPPPYSPDWAEAAKEESLMAAASRHMVRVSPPTVLQAESVLKRAAPGDLLLFRWRPNLPAKHCAILVEQNLERTPFGWRIVHAYDAAGKVAEVNLVPSWRRRCVAVFAFPRVR